MTRRSGFGWTLAAFVVFTTILSRRGHAADPVTDAIDRGVEYLLGQVKEKRVGQDGNNGIGQTALETYALLVADVGLDEPVIRENFEFLHAECKKREFDHTYSLACYIFALDAAISQIENDLLVLAPRKVQEAFRDDPRIGKEFRPYLAAAVQKLVETQTDGGAWNYGGDKSAFDNSNTQFAVLALGVGAKRGVPIDSEVWKKIVEHFVKGQEAKGPETPDRIVLLRPSEKKEREEGVKLVGEGGATKSDNEKKGEDGGEGSARRSRTGLAETPAEPEVGLEGIKVYRRGWNYQRPGNPHAVSWNMTCAGLSSLILARQNLRAGLTPQEREALNAAVRDGYGWVMGSWSPTESFYGSYSLEKVGDLGEVKLFGSHDWYKELSEAIAGKQRGNGSWVGGSHETARVATSFALLILNRATSLLTRNPASRIMVTGRGSGAVEPNDRNWVYVPSIDTSIHYPTLLRQIRQRPRLKLIQFLKDIIESYPPEWKGELIPEMARVRDEIPHKATQKLITSYLEIITGHEYKNPDDYLKWHRRWERVMAIGGQRRGEKDLAQELIEYYKSTTKSFPLKQSVMWALQQCKVRDAIPLFIADLKHEDERVRISAYSAIKAFYVAYPPPFNVAAPAAERDQQAAAIAAWCEAEEKKLKA
jgi:hypothetical protein